jgi:hypothetical protein
MTVAMQAAMARLTSEIACPNLWPTNKIINAMTAVSTSETPALCEGSSKGKFPQFQIVDISHSRNVRSVTLACKNPGGFSRQGASKSRC